MTPAQHDAARTGPDTTRHDTTRHDTTRHDTTDDRTGPDRTGPERRSRAATAAARAATAAIGHRPPIAESTRARARARGHLSTAEYKWLSELFQSMILMAGDQE